MKNKNLETKDNQRRKESPICHLISDEFLASCEYIKENNKTYTILETDDQSKIKKIKITKCPNDVFVYKLNENIKFSNYFSINEKFINKVCDFIIFFRHTCFVVEIKSDAPNILDTSNQLKNAEFFIKYLNLLSDEFFKTKIKKINKLVIKTGQINEDPLDNKNYKEFIVFPVNQNVEFDFEEINKLF